MFKCVFSLRFVNIMAEQRTLFEVIIEYKDEIQKCKEEILGKIERATDYILADGSPKLIITYMQFFDRLYNDAKEGRLGNSLDSIAKALNPYEHDKRGEGENKENLYQKILAYKKEQDYRGMKGFNRTLKEMNVTGRKAAAYRMTYKRNMPKKRRR